MDEAKLIILGYPPNTTCTGHTQHWFFEVISSEKGYFGKIKNNSQKIFIIPTPHTTRNQI